MEKTLSEVPVYQEKPIYVLFDYENRDPLDHQAAVTICDIEETEPVMAGKAEK